MNSYNRNKIRMKSSNVLIIKKKIFLPKKFTFVNTLVSKDLAQFIVKTYVFWKCPGVGGAVPGGTG